MSRELSLRITGFLSALLLTLTAYYIIVNPAYFNLDAQGAVIAIFTLALIQSMVQLIFFIDIWQEKEVFWNLAVFFSTASIIFIIIYFSIWIIDHLNYHMH